MLHPQSGQAIFVGPHWYNPRWSQMMDSTGFVAALFAVIVLPVSAAEKIQDKPIIQYLQYLIYFQWPLPVWQEGCDWGKKMVLGFNDQIAFGCHFTLTLLWYFWYYCSTLQGKIPDIYFGVFWVSVLLIVGVPDSSSKTSVSLDCGTGGAQISGVQICVFWPLCMFYHICTLQTSVSWTTNPLSHPTLLPGLPASPAFWPSLFSPSAIHHLIGPPERIVVLLISPAARWHLCSRSASLCLLPVNYKCYYCQWSGGTPLFTGLFFAMKLKYCTALAIESWIALTHASIVLWPSV